MNLAQRFFAGASPRSGLAFLLLVGLVLTATTATAAWLAPVEGSGNFPISVDVVNRWRDENRLDVLVLVAVANRELHYEEVGSRVKGRVRMEVTLTGPDGREVEQKRNLQTSLINVDDSLSPTLFQVFGVILQDVPLRYGRLTCRVVDVQQVREGLYNQMAGKLATAEAVADWWAPEGPRPDEALAVGDPLFLAHAPLRSWNPNQVDQEVSGESGFMQDYMHPARRYGLEQDHLQMFLPVWPAAGVHEKGDLPSGLRVQISSLDMQFAVEDTIEFDRTGLAILQSGRSAGVVYELDVNLLPEGSYRLAVAPLGAVGRGLMSGFDVTWSLAAIGRHRDRIIGEGNMVFLGDELSAFNAASLSEKERLLGAFWDKLNPDPENPVNEVYLEFQYRVAYAARFLGGFDATGAMDPRGAVFILLGPPDEVDRETVPMNEKEQADALVKVFNKNAPDREGVWAKGSEPIDEPHKRGPWWSEGGIPMPYSYLAERELAKSHDSPTMYHGFELWKYDHGGRPLFANLYSEGALGKRFLFVDQSGTGDFVLKSSNVIQGED